VSPLRFMLAATLVVVAAVAVLVWYADGVVTWPVVVVVGAGALAIVGVATRKSQPPSEPRSPQ